MASLREKSAPDGDLGLFHQDENVSVSPTSSARKLAMMSRIQQQNVGRRRKLVGRSPHDAILIDSDSDHEERHLSKKSKRAIETPKGDVRSEDTTLHKKALAPQSASKPPKQGRQSTVSKVHKSRSLKAPTRAANSASDGFKGRSSRLDPATAAPSASNANKKPATITGFFASAFGSSGSPDATVFVDKDVVEKESLSDHERDELKSLPEYSQSTLPELDAKAGLPSSILKLSSERKTSKQDVRFFSPALAEELRFDKNAPSNDVQALKAALKQARSAKDLFASSLDLFREHLSATRAVEAESVEREEYPGTQMEDSNDPDELAPGNDTIAKEPTDPATGQISSIDTNTEAAPTTSSTQSTPGSRPDAAGANTEEVTEEACTRSHDHAIEQGGYQSQRFREALTHAKASRGNGPGEEVRAAARLAQLLALTDGLSEVLEVKQAGTAAMSLQLQATRDWANTKHGELVAALQQFDKAADDLNTIRISGHNAVMREQVKASMSGLNDCFDLIYKVYDWYEEKLSELAGLFAEHGLDMGTIEDDGMMGRLME